MTPPEAPETKHTPWNRRDWLILLAVLLLGAALRFWQLGITPPGFQFDEAYNAIDAEQLLEGNRPLFLPANGGREVLFTYFQAGLIALLGSSVWSFRLASALWGTAAVGAAYLLFRLLLRRDSRLIATFGALALAISYWHIHFSHFGIRVITMPVIFSALFGSFYAATHATTRPRRLLLYALAGVLLGASVWSNPTGRLAPFVLLAWVVVLLWRNKEERSWRIDAPVVGLLITGVVAFLVFLPLGIEFLRNPDFFFGHASEVSVFAERVSGERGALAALADNVLHVLGMFTFYGDLEWTHGIPGRPVLDWIIGIPFYIGVVVWALRLFGKGRKQDVDGDALWLLALWVVVMLAPSVLSEAAPNYSRTLPALPAALLPVALGLAWIVRRRWSRTWMGYALAGALLTGSLVWTYFDYFIRFPQMEGAYYAYDVDKADALTLLRERGANTQTFLSPLWAEHAPVRWARGGSGIKTLDPEQALVLPEGEGAVYAYTGEEGVRAEALAERLNMLLADSDNMATVAVEEIRDKYDKALLWLVSLEAEEVAALGDSSAEPLARFDDAPSLMDASLDDAGNVIIEWRAEAPTLRNLTAFVHLIDRDGNRVAQADRIPGDGSYPTPTWSAGERVIDTLPLEWLDPCVGGDTVRLVAGWYEYAAEGARRPRLDAPGDLVVVDEFRAPLQPLAPEEVTPATAIEGGLRAGALTIFGYTLHDAESVHANTPATVDLYLRVDNPASLTSVELASLHEELGGIFEERPIDTPLPSTMFAEPGSFYCQRVRLPATTTARTDAIGELLPPPLASRATPVDATVGGSIVLQGAEIGDPTPGVLPVTLYWYATDAPLYPYTAFVQLLGEDGSFITGSDVQATPPTQHWAPGEQYETMHMLSLPADLPAGEYRLVGGLYDALTHERLPAADPAGNPLPDNLVSLGEVVIR